MRKERPSISISKWEASAALAESCYGSKRIPQSLNPAIKASARSSPDSRELLQSLVAEYNTAYKKAILDRKLWNGTKQVYSNAFNCTDASDVAMIRQLEGQILSGLTNAE